MSTSSSLIAETGCPQPRYVRYLDRTEDNEAPPLLFMAALWIFQAIFSGARLHFDRNVPVVTIPFQMEDVVFGLFISWILSKGLKRRKLYLVLPWVLASFYELYFRQFQNLRRMIEALQMMKNPPFLAWPTLAITSLALGSRVIFIIYIIKEAYDIWSGKGLVFEF